MAPNVRFAVAVLVMLSFVAGPAGAQSMQLPEPVGMDGDPAARLVLSGNSAFLQGDLAAADADYRAALRRKPDFAVATFDLGLVEIHEGRRMPGLAHLDRGIALAREHGMATSYIARLRALRNAFSEQRSLT